MFAQHNWQFLESMWYFSIDIFFSIASAFTLFHITQFPVPDIVRHLRSNFLFASKCFFDKNDTFHLPSQRKENIILHSISPVTRRTYQFCSTRRESPCLSAFESILFPFHRHSETLHKIYFKSHRVKMPFRWDSRHFFALVSAWLILSLSRCRNVRSNVWALYQRFEHVCIKGKHGPVADVSLSREASEFPHVRGHELLELSNKLRHILLPYANQIPWGSVSPLPFEWWLRTHQH